MMKKQIMIGFLLVFIATNAFGGERKHFGIGIITGTNSGLSAKYMIDNDNGIDFTLGWDTSDFDELYFSADYLFHINDLITVKKGLFPLYVGIGGRYLSREHKDNKIGVRVPVGLEYVFLNSALGAFVELVPTLDLSPDTDFEVDFGLGIRFFF